MTVRQCYEAMGGNYEEVIGRLLDDIRIKKYLEKFLADESIEQLGQALDEKNYEEAFKAVHNLKGIAANMSLTCLHQLCEKMTEDLRGGQYSKDVPLLFEQIKDQYQIVKYCVTELLKAD